MTTSALAAAADALPPAPAPAPADLGTVLAPDTVRFERLLPGPVERVWSYLVESEKRGLWLASGTLEPRVGGAVELTFHNATLSPEPVPERYRARSGPIASRQQVTRFEPPHALAFTWGSAAAPSEVLFELTSEGGRVRLTLTHTRLDRQARLDVTGGWHTHLAVLAAHLDRRAPPAFWSLLTAIEGAYGQGDGSGTCSAS